MQTQIVAERAKVAAGTAKSQSAAEPAKKVSAGATLSSKPKSTKVAGVIARTVQCYRDEGLIYTIKRMLVLGRK